jgi:hypothetical protein
MLKLLKYEFLSRKKLFIVSAILIAAVEAMAIFLLYRKGDWPILSGVLMGLLFIGVFGLIFLDVIINYYKHFTQSHGMMLFLTPNNGFKILGAKFLHAICELLIGIVVVGSCLCLTGYLSVEANYSLIPNITDEMRRAFAADFGSISISSFITWTSITAFFQYLARLTTAVAAITLAKTFFSRSNYYWLYAVLFYLGLSMILQFISGGAGLIFVAANGLFTGPNLQVTSLTPFFIIGMVFYVLWIIAGFIVSSKLLSKRIDL